MLPHWATIAIVEINGVGAVAKSLFTTIGTIAALVWTARQEVRIQSTSTKTDANTQAISELSKVADPPK